MSGDNVSDEERGKLLLCDYVLFFWDNANSSGLIIDDRKLL
jgi:hypothetical protein